MNKQNERTEHVFSVILLWMLYFWACVPFVYTVSFLFSSPSKANILLIIWQILAVFAALILMTIIQLVPGVLSDPATTEIVRVGHIHTYTYAEL